MGTVFDYYSGLEDRLFGRILQDVDLNDTVDTDIFMTQLQSSLHANNHQQSIRQRRKVSA